MEAVQMRTATGARSSPATGRLRSFVRFARQQPIGAAASCFVLLLIVVALAAPVIAPYAADDQDLGALLQPPSGEHFIGTDNLGRDVFSRLLHGSRVSVAVGFGSVALATAVGTSLALLSVLAGRLVDLTLQRLVDVLIAAPGIILLIALLAAVGQGFVQLVAVAATLFVAGTARIVRSSVLQVSSREYVNAARAVGASPFRVARVHILPNVLPLVIVISSIQVGNAILLESTVSFLGYGIPPPAAAWGSMLGGEARNYMVIAPWLAIAPGIAITLTVLAINLAGDALRDRLDPRLR